MSENTTRIEQFKKMANDDPGNELGHFSLARAYLDEGMFVEAAESLRRVVALNPKISKAYQLLGTALLKIDRRDEAIQQLTEGVKVADQRGDLMPRNEMTRMLQDLGAAVPETKKQAVEEVGEGQVHCRRCGLVKPRLPKPPFRGEFGEQVFQSTCASCWREAIMQGTKVINELRLPLADPQAQKVWDQHIREFLNLA